MKSASTMPHSSLTWSGLLCVTFLSAASYVFMEWLFIATKPSFLRSLPFPNDINILLFSIFFVSAVCLIPVVVMAAASQVPFLLRYRDGMIKAGSLIPSTLFACLVLMLLDNFTYTLFQFGIVSTRGITRGIYLLIFIGLIVLFRPLVLGWLDRASRMLSSQLRLRNIMVGLSLIGLVIIMVPFMNARELRSQLLTNPAFNLKNRVNILFLTSDGLGAESMPAYGYSRETTPNIDTLVPYSLVGENAFSNSGHSTGSIISALTGKDPTSTRVLWPPDILEGMESYQHLPGILRQKGYYSIQLSAPNYVDAFALNLLDGFDRVNGRNASTGVLIKLQTILPTDDAYFIYELGNRVADRLRHIFFIKLMDNPYAIVTQPGDFDTDQEKVDEVINLIESSKQPIFAHVHFMGTHGPKFAPRVQHFSVGKDPATQVDRDVDFYDDAIREFDQHVGAILQALRDSGKYDQTLLIISSDHGPGNFQNIRIPLIIHFPDDQYSGEIQSNLQILDLAPTILDYLGLEIPDWMDGTSLLHGDPGQRPIFGIALGGNNFVEDGHWVQKSSYGPPFYNIGTVDIVYCQSWYRLDLLTLETQTAPIQNPIGSCASEEEASSDQIRQWMVDHLEKYGLDTSSLPDALFSP